MKKNVISVRMSTYCLKLQQLNMSGPSIFLTTSNTQLYKLSLLIQLTPKNIKIKPKVRHQQILSKCKGYILNYSNT